MPDAMNLLLVVFVIARDRMILALGYWVLGNIHRYWVVLVLRDIFVVLTIIVIIIRVSGFFVVTVMLHTSIGIGIGYGYASIFSLLPGGV